MSILIKGMEMPEMPEPIWQGEAVPFVDVRIFADGTAVTSKGEHPYFTQYIAVPVPSHGRLIDADALFDKIPPGDLEHDEKISRTGAIADACTWVLTAPTIIPANEEGE